MSKKISAAALILSFLIVGVIFFLLNGMETKTEASKKSIGFLIPGSKDEEGWNNFQYQGAKSAVDDLGVELLLVENIKESADVLEHAVDSLVREGVEMIIFGSYNYPLLMVDYMKAHPAVSFYGISNDLQIENFVAFSVRAYQARFISGVIAALHSESGKIGYVAAMKNTEVIRGINAFALGARRINPKAEVVVAWTNSWDDEQVEKANVDKLVKGAGVDVVAYHQNRTFVPEEAEALGVKSVAYGMYKPKFSEKVLASTVSNWGKAYREIIQDYLQRKDGVNNYWLGIEKDAVGVAFFSSLVSDSSRSVVEGFMTSMKNGMDVFVGPIYDNHKKKRCEKDELISDNILRDEMDWLVEGVSEYEN